MFMTHTNTKNHKPRRCNYICWTVNNNDVDVIIIITDVVQQQCTLDDRQMSHVVLYRILCIAGFIIDSVMFLARFHRSELTHSSFNV